MKDLQTPVTVQSYRISQANIDILYPVVRNLSHPGIEQMINQRIFVEVQRLMAQQGYPQDPIVEMMGYYEIKTNERGILSISLFNYAFAGGAHGMTYQKSLTFNVQTGQLYTLQDLFKPGSNYAQEINNIIQRQIRERDMPLLQDFTGIRPDQDYYIADKALIIYFQLYELQAYVYGFTYFPISVYELQNIVLEDGPLGRMIS